MEASSISCGNFVLDEGDTESFWAAFGLSCGDDMTWNPELEKKRAVSAMRRCIKNKSHMEIVVGWFSRLQNEKETISSLQKSSNDFFAAVQEFIAFFFARPETRHHRMFLRSLIAIFELNKHFKKAVGRVLVTVVIEFLTKRKTSLRLIAMIIDILSSFAAYHFFSQNHADNLLSYVATSRHPWVQIQLLEVCFRTRLVPGFSWESDDNFDFVTQAHCYLSQLPHSISDSVIHLPFKSAGHLCDVTGYADFGFSDLLLCLKSTGGDWNVLPIAFKDIRCAETDRDLLFITLDSDSEKPKWSAGDVFSFKLEEDLSEEVQEEILHRFRSSSSHRIKSSIATFSCGQMSENNIYDEEFDELFNSPHISGSPIHESGFEEKENVSKNSISMANKERFSDVEWNRDSHHQSSCDEIEKCLLEGKKAEKSCVSFEPIIGDLHFRVIEQDYEKYQRLYVEDESSEHCELAEKRLTIVEDSSEDEASSDKSRGGFVVPCLEVARVLDNTLEKICADAVDRVANSSLCLQQIVEDFRVDYAEVSEGPERRAKRKLVSASVRFRGNINEFKRKESVIHSSLTKTESDLWKMSRKMNEIQSQFRESLVNEEIELERVLKELRSVLRASVSLGK